MAISLLKLTRDVNCYEGSVIPGVYSIKGCNGEEGVLITCPPPPRPVVTKMTQMEWKTIDN